MENEILKLQYSQSYNEYFQPANFVGTMAEAKAFFVTKLTECATNGIVIDAANKDMASFLFHYYFGLQMPENPLLLGEYSPKKGILVVGSVGVGKTYMMRAFAKMIKIPFTRCAAIASDYSERGEIAMHRFGKKSFKTNAMGHIETSKPIHHAFDDLGVEDFGKFYGTTKNCMEEIITDRHEGWENAGMKTFITTNLSVTALKTNEQTLELKYGSRVLSRLKQMCNILRIVGEDRRI
jgi:hypothetical protein